MSVKRESMTSVTVALGAATSPVFFTTILEFDFVFRGKVSAVEVDDRLLAS